MAQRRRLWPCAFVLLSVLWPAPATTGAGDEPAFTLVQDGQSSAVIVIPHKADRNVQTAAADLQTFLEKSSGVQLPIREETSGPGAPQIHVGWTDLARALKLDFAGMDREAFRIRTVPEKQALVLVGNSGLAHGYAVSDFLEDVVGVRFYMPGELGTHVPERATLRVPEMDHVEQPDYIQRYLAGYSPHDKRYVWGRRVRLHNPSTSRVRGAGHNLRRFFPREKYAKTNPEFFALVGGRRKVPRNSKEELYTQYCLTNPALIRAAIRFANDYFDKNPDQQSLSISMNDGGDYCQCGPCRAQGEVGAVDGPSFSDRWFRFVNAVAREVRKKHPDRFLGALAYGGAREVPNVVKRVEDNVVICLVLGQRCRHYDPEAKAKDDATLRAWAKFAKRFQVYDHIFDFGHAVPAFYPKLIGQLLREPRELGAIGYTSEIYTSFIQSGPKTYIFAKLLWDADEDPEKIVDEFCENMFGSAAQPMRKYFALLERRWMSQKRPARATFFRLPAQFEIYSPSDYAEGRGLLDEALRSADTPLARARVRFFSDGFLIAQLYQRAWDLHKSLDSNVRDRESARRAIEVAEELLVTERRREALLNRLDRESEIKPHYLGKPFTDRAYWDMRTMAQVALFNAYQWHVANGPEQALRQIDDILSVEGEQARLAFAVFSEKLGHVERAERIFRRIAETSEAPGVRHSAAYLLALRLRASGRLQEAREALSPLAASATDKTIGPQARRLLARVLFAMGDAAAALSACEELSSEGENVRARAAPLLLAGEMLEATGDATGARKQYERAMTIDPTRRAAMKLARLHLASGRADKARAAFGPLLLDPAEAGYRIAVLRWERGEHDQARRIWKAVADISSRKVAARNAAVRLALAAGRPVTVKRTVRVRRIPSPPKLDGRLDDACWKSAQPLDRFGPIKKDSAVTQQTVAYLAYDDKALYVGIKANESRLGQLRISQYMRDDPDMWVDDCLELFLDPDFDSVTYHYVSLNRWGVYFDSYELDRSYDGDFGVVAAQGEGHWSVELRLPFAELRVPAPRPGDVWGFNLGRERQPQPREFSMWAHRLKRWFHEPENFGCIVFD